MCSTGVQLDILFDIFFSVCCVAHPVKGLCYEHRQLLQLLPYRLLMLHERYLQHIFRPVERDLTSLFLTTENIWLRRLATLNTSGANLQSRFLDEGLILDESLNNPSFPCRFFCFRVHSSPVRYVAGIWCVVAAKANREWFRDSLCRMN